MILGMKSTFIMAEIKIVWKIGSFIHVFKCIISAKIVGKPRLSVHEPETSFNGNQNVGMGISIRNEIFIRHDL